MQMDLVIQMAADVARLRSDMDQAKGVVNNAMSGIQSAAGLATKALGLLGVGLSAGQFTSFVKDTIDAQDAMLELSQRVGVSVETLAGLEHAAGMSGTSLGTLEKGLKTASVNAFDAANGSKAAAEKFTSLGIAVTDASGKLKSSDQIMLEVSDRFAQMEDGVLKTAAANDIFGKSGGELIPLLNEGSAALGEMIAQGQQFNPVTLESAKAADQFNDNLAVLTGNASALGVEFANSLLPSLSAFSDEVVSFVEDGDLEVWLDRGIVGVEALALVLTARMVPALTATAIATTANIAESIAYQAALARMAGLSTSAALGQTALATATGALNASLALVGGPLGALTLVVGGLALMVHNMESATESTARLRAEMDGLNREELERGIRIQESYNQGIEWQIEKLSRQSQANAAVRERMAELRSELERGKKALQELERGMQKVEERELERYIDDLTEGFTGNTAAVKANTAALNSNAAATASAISNTEFLNGVYGRSAGVLEAGAAAYVDVMEAAGATWRETEKVGETFDSTGDSVRDFTLLNRSQADLFATDWENANSRIARSMADLLVYGGSLTDVIKGAGSNALSNILTDVLSGGKSGPGKSGGGLNLTSLLTSGSGLVTAGSQFLGGLTGGAIGANVMLPTAASTAGAGIASMVSAIPGWGWAVGGILAAAKLLEKESTPTSNAGFLLHDVPGASADRKFNVDPFASGFAPVGFNRRGNQQDSTDVINVFRELDSTLTQLFESEGFNVDYNASTFRSLGTSETGMDDGVFVGRATEDGKVIDAISKQADEYVDLFIKNIPGLGQDAIDKILGGNGALETIKLAQEYFADQKSAQEELNDITKEVTGSLVSLADEIGGLNTVAKSSLDSAFSGGVGDMSFMANNINTPWINNDSRNQALADQIEWRENMMGTSQATKDAYTQRKMMETWLPRFAEDPNNPQYYQDFVNLGLINPYRLGADGSHAAGLPYVPFDGYRAILHKGEEVVPAGKARQGDNMAGYLARMCEELRDLAKSNLAILNRIDEINTLGTYDRGTA
jgi:hypothetical protein